MLSPLTSHTCNQNWKLEEKKFQTCNQHPQYMWSKLWNLKRKKSFQTRDYVTFAINVTKNWETSLPHIYKKKTCDQHFYTRLKLRNHFFFFFWEACNKHPQFTCNYNQETLKWKNPWNTHKNDCNQNTCDCKKWNIFTCNCK